LKEVSNFFYLSSYVTYLEFDLSVVFSPHKTHSMPKPRDMGIVQDQSLISPLVNSSKFNFLCLCVCLSLYIYIHISICMYTLDIHSTKWNFSLFVIVLNTYQVLSVFNVLFILILLSSLSSILVTLKWNSLLIIENLCFFLLCFLPTK